MAKTYVIADLHGRLDLLAAALARIEEHTPGKVVYYGGSHRRRPAKPRGGGEVDRWTRGWLGMGVRPGAIMRTCSWTVIQAVDMPKAGRRDRVYNALVKALARAFRWQRMLDEGVCATIGELARREKFNRDT